MLAGESVLMQKNRIGMLDWKYDVLDTILQELTDKCLTWKYLNSNDMIHFPSLPPPLSYTSLYTNRSESSILGRTAWCWAGGRGRAEPAYS